jgi:hypothetical protein
MRNHCRWNYLLALGRFESQATERPKCQTKDLGPTPNQLLAKAARLSEALRFLAKKQFWLNHQSHT